METWDHLSRYQLLIAQITRLPGMGILQFELIGEYNELRFL